MTAKKEQVIKGIECPKCNDRIWSQHRHDCRYCKCGYCYIDGGREYLRFGYADGVYSEPTDIPKIITITYEELGNV